MKILGNRLLLSPLPVQEVSDGGIVLPSAAVGDKKMWWRVEQVGTHRPAEGKAHTHGTSAADYAVGQHVCTPLHFTHTTLEDGSDRKIVDCDQFVATV